MNTRLFLILAVVAAPCFPRRATAQETCDTTKFTQYAMDLCAAAKAKAALVKLDSLVATLRRRAAELPPDSRNVSEPTLDRVQKAWIAYRDLECRWEVEGLGSVAPAVASDCVEELTWQRIEELKWQLCPLQDCPEVHAYDRPKKGG